MTATEIVEGCYLDRVKAFEGTCVNEPEGLLGPISTIANAKKPNALMTLNLRPKTRQAMGFDARKARSVTDTSDDDPAMPDALEVAADPDAKFAATGELTGPLHGVVLAIRTSSTPSTCGRPRAPTPSTPTIARRMTRPFVTQLRDAGAIILAKSNAGGPMARSPTGRAWTATGSACAST